MKKYKPKDLAWFRKRIGKRIYRDWHKCCNTCDNVAKKGLIIRDGQHADYLFNIDNSFAEDKVYSNYRDKL